MLKSWNLVVREYIMVNNKNYMNNKKNRLSIVVFKDITKLQGYDSKYTWILKTHGDNPELRDLANINLFNYGKLV